MSLEKIYVGKKRLKRGFIAGLPRMKLGDYVVEFSPNCRKCSPSEEFSLDSTISKISSFIMSKPVLSQLSLCLCILARIQSVYLHVRTQFLKRVAFSYGFIAFLLAAAFTSQAQSQLLTLTKVITVPNGAISVGNGLVITKWTGGTGPFQVQSSTGLSGNWQDIAGITTNSSQTNILYAPIMFFRVADVSSVKSQLADQVAPSVPTGLAATSSGNNQVNLTWNASSDPQFKSSGLKGYNIYRNGYFLTQITAPSTSAVDTNLVPLTTYNYAVSAVDNAYNESAKSTNVTISGDSAAPTVALTSPTGGSTVSNSINLTASASDNVGVTRVEFYRDSSTLVGVATAAPFNVQDNTTNMSNGSHSYNAKAFDAAGNSSTSANVGVTVNNADTAAPVVSLTAPTSGSTVSGTITLSASASDNVGVTRVDFYRDGSTLVASDATAPYSVSDDTTVISNGSHSYTAKAYDAAGNSTTSTSVSVTISNTSTPMTGTTVWSRRFGGTVFSTDKAFTYSVKEDKNTNSIAVGFFQGTVNFGGGTVTCTNNQEMFIVKHDASGGYLWSRQFASSDGNRASAVAIDSSNNIVVVGTFSGTIDFGAGALNSAGSSDIFVAKFSPSGALLWAKRFGGSAADVCNAVALDAGNNILLTGSYGYLGTAIDFGGGALPLSGGTFAFQTDMFVTKLTANGGYVWANGYGGSGTDAGYGIAVDGQGNVAVTGSFQQSIALGGATLTSAGGYDLFVAKYASTSGSHLWSTSGGGSSGDERGNAVAFDTSGNVVVTGYFTGDATIAGNTLSTPNNTPGLNAIFLAKYSASGSSLWSRSFVPVVSFGYGIGNGVAVDSVGNIVLTGYVCGAVGFDGTYLGNGDADVLLAKFTASGSTIWAKSYGSNGNDAGTSVAIGAGNTILTSGYYYQSADFGAGLLQSSASNDGFVFKTTP